MAGASSTTTVLIAEDEEELRALYADWLATTDYEVHAVSDGEAAFEEYSPTIDIVLLDRRMPGMSGDEVLAKLAPEASNTKFAMVTAVEPDVDILEMGFHDYLQKPFSKTDLVDLVKGLETLHAYDDSIERYFQLARKKAALEASKSSQYLENSDEYKSLVKELRQVQQEADAQVQQADFEELLQPKDT